MLEALQYVHATRIGAVPGPMMSDIADGTLPFTRCLLRNGFFFPGGGSIDVGLPTYPELETVKRGHLFQLRALLESLASANINVYSRTLLASPVTVVQVIAPRLERFHLVSYGVAVLPGSRGEAVLN